MLVTQVVSSEGVSSIVIALHLSDQLGDFAGTHAVVDADWNIQIIGNLDYINSVRFSDFSLCRIIAVLSQFVDQTQSHQFFIQANDYFEDNYNDNQIHFLSQYFKQNPNCVFYGNAVVGKTILQLLHPSQLLAVYSDKWFLYL